MKNLISIIAIAFIILSNSVLKAQTTEVKVRTMEAVTSPDISYVECRICGFGVYIIPLQKKGLPIYHHYLKDLSTGKIRFAFTSYSNRGKIIDDPCNTICSIIVANPN